MLGRMMNIVFDDEGMEGSKSNPIIVYDEPENSGRSEERRVGKEC